MNKHEMNNKTTQFGSKPPTLCNSTHQITCISSETTNLMNKQPSDLYNNRFHQYLPINPQLMHIFSPNTSSSSHLYDHHHHNHNHNHTYNGSGNANSSSPLDDQIQLSNIMDERRKRRMESNRESARRSRMRKKKQIEELQTQVDQLLSMNHQLSEKVIHLLETNHQIIAENTQLKDKVSSLHLIFSDMLTPARSVEEVSRNNNNNNNNNYVRSVDQPLNQ